MDRRVKERLVGACLLVVLFILVVPELLSGPKPMASASTTHEPTHTVNVDLNTNKAAVESGDPIAPGEPPPAALEAPPPVATPPTLVTPHEASEPTTVAPPVAKPIVAKPVAAPPKSAEASGNWTVQAGTFQSRSNADALVRTLKGQGFTAAVSEGRSGKKLFYRVRSGGLADRAAAERLAAKLKAAGHAGSVVVTDSRR